MKIQPQLTQTRIDAMTKAGYWPNRVLTDYLDDAVAAYPDRVAVTDINSMTGAMTTLSFRQLARRVDRIALRLVALGVEPGDVVSYQLPNWWQFTALHLACVRVGAVTNPVMPIFRHRELEFMLGLAEAKVFIVPRVFRAFDYPKMVEEIRPKLPALKHVFVMGGEGAQSFEDHFLKERLEDRKDAAAILKGRKLKPNDVMQLLYTSGTTGEPKGALHTSNTIFANATQFAKRMNLAQTDAVLMASPMAHQTGFGLGMIMPMLVHAKSVLQDIWDAEVAMQRIQDESVTFTMAATPFLADITDSPVLGNYDIRSLKVFASGGAPIPRALAIRAAEKLKANIVSVWGMTENMAVTCTKLNDSDEKIFSTDGVPVPGMEIRVVDSAGTPLPVGEEGELQARGPSNYVGYLKRPDLYCVDKDGWLSTGDLARIDADGYVRITGRAKDLIIRGGENIPVIEVEQLLYRHPAIQSVAIVGAPDPRLGERAVAFAVLKPGATFSFEDMKKFLNEHKMARTYFPERLEILKEFPCTPSGKIQKFRLREIAKQMNIA